VPPSLCAPNEPSHTSANEEEKRREEKRREEKKRREDIGKREIEKRREERRREEKRREEKRREEKRREESTLDMIAEIVVLSLKFVSQLAILLPPVSNTDHTELTICSNLQLSHQLRRGNAAPSTPLRPLSAQHTTQRQDTGMLYAPGALAPERHQVR
jgi:hypothetical protein